MFKSLFFSSLLIGSMLLSLPVPSAVADDGDYRGHYRGRGRYQRHTESYRPSRHERRVYYHHEHSRYCGHNAPVYGYQDYDYRPRRHRHHHGVDVRIGVPFLPLPPLPHHFILRELLR